MAAERESSALPASGLAVVIALVLGFVAFPLCTSSRTLSCTPQARDRARSCRLHLHHVSARHALPRYRTPPQVPRTVDSNHRALVAAVNRSYNSHIRLVPPGSSNRAFDRHQPRPTPVNIDQNGVGIHGLTPKGE